MEIKLNATDYEQLLKLHSEWKAAEDSIPENEWQRGYKHRSSVALKKWRSLDEFCKKHSLSAVQVATDLNLLNHAY